MKIIVKSIVLIIGIFISVPALSDSTTNNLGRCMIDALNGKERKQLAKWIFFAIAAHPEINSYSRATTKDINESDDTVGKLITRLLTSDCPNELKIAYKSDPLTVQKSFELVGQVAMQELMTNQNVMKSITNYAQYADQKKINSLLTEK
ncbi:MAG: hypothetical protein Q7S46_09055 [Gallionella sp.]|nr:hypothetical protein [Gallionella sp.]